MTSLNKCYMNNAILKHSPEKGEEYEDHNQELYYQYDFKGESAL